MTPLTVWRLLERSGRCLPVAGLEQYVAELVRWNRSVRLVGPRDAEGIGLQVVDALLPFFHAAPAFPLLDIGSGAGLPGIPLALCYPQERVVCLEPRAKRVSFLRHCVRVLGLEGVEVCHGRTDSVLEAEEGLRGFARCATARAVADVRTLLREAQPFLRAGGRVVLPRGGVERVPTVAGWQCAQEVSYVAPKPLGERSVLVYEASAGGPCFT